MGNEMDTLTKHDIKSMDFDELKDYVVGIGEKEFRAKQIYQWIHERRVSDFNEMTNISKDFRELLSRECFLSAAEIIKRQQSKDGTNKFLMGLKDGNTVESVLMKYHHGNSVCISTQVGCRMGCRFCASTVGGLVRDLSPGEMLDEIYSIRNLLGERISNIILMGIGEPLDNYDNVLKFIKMVSDDRGINISQRNITISTCGLVEKIRELAEKHFQITLAVSLHAPNDKLRREIMPIANKYSISDLIDACRYYVEKTKRRITFEYSLIEGENDAPEQADELSKLLRGLNCHVNLIPLNPVKGRFGERSDKNNIHSFKFILEKNHINVTIRREMGSDIDAACGQLRNNNKGGKLS